MIDIVQIFFSRSLYLCHPYNIQLKCTRNNSYFPCFIKLKFFWKKIIIPPLHRRGGAILFYLCPSFYPSERKSFSSHFSQQLFCGRNLIFGHKLHIGTPYCGKCFWTRRQIPTSCLPTQLVFIHIEHICWGIICVHQLTVHLVWCDLKPTIISPSCPIY